jgi:hypothetical protein
MCKVVHHLAITYIEKKWNSTVSERAKYWFAWSEVSQFEKPAKTSL